MSDISVNDLKRQIRIIAHLDEKRHEGQGWMLTEECHLEWFEPFDRVGKQHQLTSDQVRMMEKKRATTAPVW